VDHLIKLHNTLLVLKPVKSIPFQGCPKTLEARTVKFLFRVKTTRVPNSFQSLHFSRLMSVNSRKKLSPNVVPNSIYRSDPFTKTIPTDSEFTLDPTSLSALVGRRVVGSHWTTFYAYLIPIMLSILYYRSCWHRICLDLWIPIYHS